MRRKPPREQPPGPDRPAPPRQEPPGEIGDDGGGQRSDVGVPYTGEGNVQRPPERRIPRVTPEAPRRA